MFRQVFPSTLCDNFHPHSLWNCHHPFNHTPNTTRVAKHYDRVNLPVLLIKHGADFTYHLFRYTLLSAFQISAQQGEARQLQNSPLQTLLLSVNCRWQHTTWHLQTVNCYTFICLLMAPFSLFITLKLRLISNSHLTTRFTLSQLVITSGGHVKDRIS